MTRFRWLQVIVALAVLFGAGFLLLGDNPVLSGVKARDWLTQHGPWAAAASVAMLAGDIFLPVPSSVVMTLNGTLFGPWLGMAISFAGSMLAWLGCYGIGRLAGLAGRKPALDDDQLSKRVKRYGIGLLIATRPVPIVAELVASACGVARMSLARFLLGAALGVLPISAMYAFIGHATDGIGASWIALAIAVLLPLALYLVVSLRCAPHRPPAVLQFSDDRDQSHR